MFRASLRPSSGGQTAFSLHMVICPVVTVVMLESRLASCVHCVESVKRPTPALRGEGCLTCLLHLVGLTFIYFSVQVNSNCFLPNTGHCLVWTARNVLKEPYILNRLSSGKQYLN